MKSTAERYAEYEKFKKIDAQKAGMGKEIQQDSE
jgi:hypothetical protein